MPRLGRKGRGFGRIRSKARFHPIPNMNDQQAAEIARLTNEVGVAEQFLAQQKKLATEQIAAAEKIVEAKKDAMKPYQVQADVAAAVAECVRKIDEYKRAQPSTKSTKYRVSTWIPRSTLDLVARELIRRGVHAMPSDENQAVRNGMVCVDTIHLDWNFDLRQLFPAAQPALAPVPSPHYRQQAELAQQTLKTESLSVADALLRHGISRADALEIQSKFFASGGSLPQVTEQYFAEKQRTTA